MAARAAEKKVFMFDLREVNAAMLRCSIKTGGS